MVSVIHGYRNLQTIEGMMFNKGSLTVRLQVRLECNSFDTYNETKNLLSMVERYRQRAGNYPEQVLVDKIYRNRVSINYCTE